MRLSTLLFAVVLIALILTIVRDEVGRVALIVFLTGVGMVGSGLAAMMALFQTVGAFGEARDVSSHLEALAATILVLMVGSLVMLGVIFAGILLVQWSVP